MDKVKNSMTTVTILGGGLAGSECAWQLAERGHRVVLYEQRRLGPRIESEAGASTVDPSTSTPAHRTDRLAELVCSNSFGSQTDYSAPGQLKWEADRAGSLILKAAREAAIPAGMALGVDRVLFAESVTRALESHPMIEIRRERVETVDDLPRPLVVATGPLTYEPLARSIFAKLRNESETLDAAAMGGAGTQSTDDKFLYFFDAIAPVIDADTIDMNKAWKANRFDKAVDADGNTRAGNSKDTPSSASPGGDYINCPMNKEQYFAFIEAIKKARKVEPKEFEKNTPFFEGCMPIEAMVDRGDMTPRFGPMSSKGLFNPHEQGRPFAVVQLRQENSEATAYNMVGFQTKMAYGDQKEVFRMIPGLENAEFLKLGSIHRNMYIHSPRKLSPVLSAPRDPGLFFAGQITGVEGYFDSTCIGLMVSLFVDDYVNGRATPVREDNAAPDSTYFIRRPPRASAFGSLLNAITEPKEHFQPTNINFGLFPLLGMNIKTKQEREQKREIQLERAKAAWAPWISERLQR